MQTTLPTGVKVYADSLRDQLVHGSTGFSQTREQRARARARISNSHAATMPLYLETSTLDASVDPHSLYSVAMKRKAFKERKESEKKRQEEKVMQLREIRRRETEAEFLRTKEAVARKIKEKDEQFHAMLRNLDAERPFVDSIEAFIREHEQDELRRKEKLYLEWMQEVYLPIQQQIEEALGAVTTAQIEAKRREMFEEFLKNSNRNHGVFRDIIQEEIYDPFKLTRTAPKYSVQRIRDPCKKELQKKSEETVASAELTVGEGSLRKSLIAAASLIASAPASTHSQSSSPPGSPDRLRPSVWDKADCIPEVRYESPTSPTDLALGSGPSSPSLARFSESAAPARATRSFGKGRPQRSQSSSPSSELGQSRVVLDHFQYAKDQAVVKAEYFSKGKRVFAGRSQAETQAPLESSE